MAAEATLDADGDVLVADPDEAVAADGVAAGDEVTDDEVTDDEVTGDDVTDAAGGGGSTIGERARWLLARGWPALTSFVVALVVRLMAAWWVVPPCTPEEVAVGSRDCFDLGGDPLYYFTQARLIDEQGRWFASWLGQASAEHPPLMTLFLYGLRLLGLTSPDGARLGCLIAGAVGCALVALAAQRFATGRASRVVGLVAGLLAALCPVFWINDVQVKAESLFLGAVALTLLAAQRLWIRRDLGSAAWTGAAVGLSWLIRPEAILYAVVLVPFLLLRFSDVPWRRRLLQAALVLAVPAAMMAPWAAYNLSRFENPAPITTTGGRALLMNNCDDAYYGGFPGYQSYACLYVADRAVPGDETDLSIAQGNVANEFLDRNRNQVPLMSWIRLRRIWGLYSYSEAVLIDGYLESFAGWTAPVMWVTYYAMVPLAVAGGYLLWRRKQPLVPVLVPFAVVSATAVGVGPVTRFRISADVSLTILTAVALVGWSPVLWAWFKRRRGELWSHLRPRPAGVVLAVAFVGSRIAAAASGVTFDTGPLIYSWQLIDPTVLQDQPWSAVWNLHTQPPLYNLFVGLVLNSSPIDPTFTYRAFYLGLGVVLTWALYDLARRLGANKIVATAVTAVIVVAPATILYENWLSYEYPVAVGLVLLADLVHRYVDRGRLVAFAGIAAVGAAMVLTRSLLHPVWLALVFAVVLFARRPSFGWRRAGLVMAVPAILVAGWMLKNQAVFGTATLSSWAGMNVSRTTTGMLDGEARRALIADGTLSPLADQPAFRPLDTYESAVGNCLSRFPRVPAVNDPTRHTTLPVPNFNHDCFLPVYDQFQRDAIASLRARPGDVVKGQVTAFQEYLRPTSDYGWLKNNREAIDGYDRFFRTTLLLEHDVDRVANTSGAISIYETVTWFNESFTTLLALLIVIYEGIRAVVGWRRRGVDATRVTYVVIAGTCMLVTVVGNAFEIGENNRFRFLIEPLMLLVLGLWIGRIVRWVWLRVRGASAVELDEGLDGVGEGSDELDHPDAADERADERDLVATADGKASDTT